MDIQQDFNAAVQSILTAAPRIPTGIGMQKEKSLHAILKKYIDPCKEHQEVPVGNFIADICDPKNKTITEIQTANFGAMKDKLEAFLPEYQVRILHPIAHRKTVCWIDPETGEITASNVSTCIGSFYELFRELSRITEYIGHPNLTVEALLIDLEEYRMQDGWGNGGKRGSHRFDRMPTGIYERLVLQGREDYSVFLPKDLLPEPFTARDLETAVGIHRKSLQYSAVLKVLTQIGVTRRVGLTSRRAFLYQVQIPNETGHDFCRKKSGRRGCAPSDSGAKKTSSCTGKRKRRSLS